ncbi:MAG TPA: EAL domain-containing protein [Pseudolabrys sp.]|nr:EAL domain-containing protein [Pseudolabrys sp.]
MGPAVRAMSRHNLIAIAVGVFLAGAPLLVFNLWFGNLLDRQSQREIDNTAQRAVSVANARLSQALAALDDLSGQGVASCAGDAVETMRVASFLAAPVKQIAVMSPDGETLCSDVARPPGSQTLLTTQAAPSKPGVFLDFVRVGEVETMVRLRRTAGAGPNQLAALVPLPLLLPQASTDGGPLKAFAGIIGRDGARLGGTGARPDAVDGSIVQARSSSRLFGFDIEIVAPRDLMLGEHASLRWIGILISALIIVAVAGFLLLVPRRNPNDPVTQLAEALDAGEFVPYYQPVVDIRSGQLRGAEVLVRWKKPDGSLVLPGAFIPLAESSGLIQEMTRHLMRQVCAEAGPALGRRPALKISFNFAGKLFADDSIVKDVRKIFSASPIKLTQVVLEVTERDPIENLTQARQIIAALQGLGVRIAIDDVGTGHSGLSYMLKLGVDIIKIDKMFVDAIGSDRNSNTIVETLVDLAHNMRMDVVAEGVENFEQVMHLRELGIRSAQGYVFAPPLPGSAFLELVEAIDPVGAGKDKDTDDKEKSGQAAA